MSPSLSRMNALVRRTVQPAVGQNMYPPLHTTVWPLM
jgi:hypothetical protein